MPTRSTTTNHCPRPTSLSALIKNASAPCVTAVDKLAILALGRRCPVLSKKLYTATTTGLPAAGGGITSNSFCIRFLTLVGFSGPVIILVAAHPVKHNSKNNANTFFITLLLEYKLSQWYFNCCSRPCWIYHR